jgi:iron complex transport system substrate-binding protein
MRIVSLLPSTTEIVCALGLESCLAGRSHECDFPPSIRRLPACTEAKIRADAPGGEIDREVKSLLEQALGIYRVRADALRTLRPTHILTQTQCDVCAVSLTDVEEALIEWLGIPPQAADTERPKIVATEAFALAGVWWDIQRIADALDAPERGRELVRGLQSRMAEIEQRAGTLPEQSVACIEWIEPLMTSGNWMPELVAKAGGRNLFGDPGRHAPWINWDAVVAADPDFLLILPCGLDIARVRQELPALTSRTGWDDLTAVRERRVYLLDGNQYFNRPGPRLAESVEILAEILHPEEFHFGHQGTGWQPL